MRRRPAVAAALAVALASGCQFLVDGDIETVRCTQEGAIGPPACPEDLSCVKGSCTLVTGGGRELGSICEADAECLEGLLCLRPFDFGGAGAPVCSKSCCTSNECGDVEDGFVCWAPPKGGGSFCRRAASVNRTALGSGKVGEPCFVDDYCRSGLCVEGACVDTCCVDTQCTVGDAVCRLRVGVVSEGANWACGSPPLPAAAFLALCGGDADCGSGLCIVIGGEKRCSKPCCDSAVCGPAVAAGFPGLLACVNVPHKGALVRSCARWLPEASSGAVGAACTEDLQCRGGRCIEGGTEGERICSDVCCTDASCGDTASYACRPHPVGSKWALRCEVK